jgi:DNA-binding MarR family transcriptional regulator
VTAISTSDIRLGDIHRVMRALEVGMPDAIILLVLRRYGERHAEIRPELATLEAATGLARRGVQYAVQRLVDAGLVTVRKRHKTSSVYALTDASCAQFLRANLARKNCARSDLSVSSPVPRQRAARSVSGSGQSPLPPYTHESPEGADAAEPPSVGSDRPTHRTAGTPPPLTLRQPADEGESDEARSARMDAILAQIRQARPAKPAPVNASVSAPEPPSAVIPAVDAPVSPRSDVLSSDALDRMRAMLSGEGPRAGAQDAPGRTETGQDDRR